MQKCHRNEQILEVKYAKMKFTEGGVIKLRLVTLIVIIQFYLIHSKISLLKLSIFALRINEYDADILLMFTEKFLQFQLK